MNGELMGVELPLSIELLFQNKKLDIISLLCILSCFHKKRKGVTVDEATFYYSIVTSGAEISINDKVWDINDARAKVEVDANLMLIRERVKEIVIVLTNVGYVDFEFSNEHVQLKINKSGLDIVNSLSSGYFSEIINKTNDIKEIIRFNKTNEKRIELGVVKI